MKYLFKLFFLTCYLSYSCLCFAKIQIINDDKKSIFLLDSSDKNKIDLDTVVQLKDDYFISGEYKLLTEDDKKILLAIPISLDYYIKKEILSYSKVVYAIFFATYSCLIYFFNFRVINAKSYRFYALNNFLFIGAFMTLLGTVFKILDFSSNLIEYRKFPLIFHVEGK